MSRGFVREGDQEEVPMVPQRAYLPSGVTNFVTRNGLDLLIAEREELLKERNSLGSDNENEKRITVNYINSKLQLLNERISGARVVDPTDQPQDEVRFGASVKIRNVGSGKEQVFQVVGVDEADISKGKISFISPLAKAMLNQKKGSTFTLKREMGDIVFEIVDITY